MLADETVVGLLCTIFAEAAEPEASAFLLKLSCMSKVRTEPVIHLACLLQSSHHVYSVLHDSKYIASLE